MREWVYRAFTSVLMSSRLGAECLLFEKKLNSCESRELGCPHWVIQDKIGEILLRLAYWSWISIASHFPCEIISFEIFFKLAMDINMNLFGCKLNVVGGSSIRRRTVCTYGEKSTVGNRRTKRKKCGCSVNQMGCTLPL